MEKNHPSCIITGASRGIGHAIAQRFDAISLSRTASDIPTFKCDVSDFTSVYDAFLKIPPCSVLVNCAGIVEPKPFRATSWESWKRQTGTNLNGAFLVSRFFVDQFMLARTLPRPGVIVNISSTAGMRPSPNWLGYSSSKAGLINLSLTMAEELKPDIKVYTLALGRCATALRKKIAPDEDQSKIMQPSEVADFVEYLIREKPPLKGVIEVSRT